MHGYRKKWNKLLLTVAISSCFALMLSVLSIVFALTRSDYGFLLGPICATSAVIAYIISFINIYRLQQHTL